MYKPQTLELKNQIDKLADIDGISQVDIAAKLGIKLSKVRTLRAYPERRKKREEHSKQRYKERLNAPYGGLKRKVDMFKRRDGFEDRCTIEFTWRDVVAKFGPSPICHLTGRTIDWQLHKDYQLDHIISLSVGGTSNLANMAIACPEANQMKRHHSIAEFVALCREVVKHADKA